VGAHACEDHGCTLLCCCSTLLPRAACTLTRMVRGSRWCCCGWAPLLSSCAMLLCGPLAALMRVQGIAAV
jgi:hypothetical protein